MELIEITSREFRDKQKTYFNLVDDGKKLIIKRGNKQSYLLTPIDSEDIQISAKMELKIQQAIDEISTGSTIKISTEVELNKFLESL